MNMVDIKILSPLPALKKCSILRVMNNIFINHEPTRTEEETTNGAFGACTNKDTNKPKIIYKDECYKIYHCVYEVYNKLGNGFLESVYHEALEIELAKENIPFESQKMIQVYYDDKLLSQYFRADIVCYNKIIMELKVVNKINNEHKAQLMNYLAATKMKLGLLINFGTYPKVEICRIIN
jgi:GxxExxY protein